MRRLPLFFLYLLACTDGQIENHAAMLDAGDSVLDASTTDAHQPVEEAAAAPGYRAPPFCAGPLDDAVRDIFCADHAPQVNSLEALYEQLGLIKYPRAQGDSADAGDVVHSERFLPAAAYLGHSTALSGRLVSPINPRAVLWGEGTAVAFQRGLQQVELAAASRGEGRLSLYLLEFTQACNETGCRPGDLYTSRVETDWLSVTIREADELKNTSLDCRQCHQRGRDTPVLLMRELDYPSTHFFERAPSESEPLSLPGVRGWDLIADYERAKGDESYAGLPSFLLHRTGPGVLKIIVNRDQPLVFDAPKIEAERWPVDELSGRYAASPRNSPAWDLAYEAFKRGEQLALPHFDPRPTDPRKQAALTEAYRRYRSGELSADDLPDLADIYPDDTKERARIGLQNEPDSTPAQALVQVCASCHNDVLDQTISRAKFSVALERMSRAELDLAIQRLQRDPSTSGAMPPAEARQLDPEARAAMIMYLRQNARAPVDDAFLTRAAKLGMSGGAVP